MMTSDEAPEGAPDFDDFDERRLCDDGNCTGLIGPDGRCKECGRPAGSEGDPAPRLFAEEDDSPIAAESDAASAFDEDRRLCSDGNCTGLIGPDGCCKECGRLG
jgi:hypothetical protein